MFPQCATDDECTFGGVMPTYKCLKMDLDPLGEVRLCGEGCAKDEDCTTPDTKCTGEDKDGVKFCTGESSGGCTKDEDCKGMGKCDTGSGACVCTDDSECTGTGVDKCVKP
jgi:hypothetical protein